LASSISSSARTLGLCGPPRFSRRSRTVAGFGRCARAIMHRNTPAANKPDVTSISCVVIVLTLDLDGHDLAHHEVADAHHHDGAEAHDQPARDPGPEG